MSKCINNCGIELTGRQKQFCSDKCRMQHKRKAEQTNSNSEPEQIKLEQIKSNTVHIVEKGSSTPFSTQRVLPANFGEADCACKHCQQNRASGSKLTLNHGKDKLASGELRRVSLPGDVDYDGVCNDSKCDDHRISLQATASALLH